MEKSAFINALEAKGVRHFQIPKTTYNADVETVHHLVELEYYEVERFKDRRDFFLKASTYQRWFNSGSQEQSQVEQEPFGDPPGSGAGHSHFASPEPRRFSSPKNSAPDRITFPASGIPCALPRPAYPQTASTPPPVNIATYTAVQKTIVSAKKRRIPFRSF
jgi:hypothetical protein